MNWNYVWGFGVSLVLGGVTVWLIIDIWLYNRAKNKIMERMKEESRKKDDEQSGREKDNEEYIKEEVNKVFKKPDVLAVTFMGAIERFAYTSCIILEVPHWIAIWLAFKVLTRWKPAPQESAPGKEVLLANIYLVGNLLGVIFGVIGGLICKYGSNMKDLPVLLK